jgi:polyisoprenyl-teichoic acid--peptidoglycan teichoic acid transferase
MRQLALRNKSRSIVKILAASFAMLFLVIVAIKLLGLGDLVIGGPKTVVNLITNTGLKSANNRINVLLLGSGGYGHEGPDLSDTMILASVDEDGRDVVLVSIPRDLWAPSLVAKINSAYAYGQEQGGQGLELAKKTVRELFDLPVHYAIRVDFDGFTRAVDLVGGIDVDVETPFTDPRYPVAGREDDTCGLEIMTEEKDGIARQVIKDATGSAIPFSEITQENNPFNCRYETLSFKKGITHMDGATSLKFVRSRYGTSGEGSDFARSARQQKLILALRQKVLSTQTLLNPETTINLATTFENSIDTDITNDEIPLFVKLGQRIEPTVTRRVVLDGGRDGSVLEFGDPVNYGGQFVLIPKGGSWGDLAEYVQGEIFRLKEK